MDWILGIWNKISAPFKAIGKLWGSIFGGDASVDADIKTHSQSTQTTLSDSKSTLINGQNQPLPVATHPSSISRSAVANTVQPQSKVFNNSFNITVQAAPGQDTRRIADEVVRCLKEQSRGALFDIAGAVL